MRAVELLRTRILYSEAAFAELVLWQVPKPVDGSTHGYKYRLAYVVGGECVLRCDNEAGNEGVVESAYDFSSPEQLIADFQRDIARCNDENSNS